MKSAAQSPTPEDRPVRVVVLYGGQSAEHEVSRVTAAHVLAAIDRSRYTVEAIGIDRDGQWRLFEPPADVESLPALPVAGTIVSPPEVFADSNADQLTVVLPLLHGPMGEDGTVQGLLELANVPYVGAGVLGSALAMDKAAAKATLSAAGVPQARWRAIHEPAWSGDEDAITGILHDLGETVFVKPANMGSSVGVSKATGSADVRVALKEAFRYDEWAVVEETIVGRELELAVLGNVELEFSVPGEIVPGAEFYDYDDKYVDGAAKLIIPAELSRSEVAEMERLAAQAYRALRVEGMGRVDFLYEPNGRGFLLNEINTIPGFTPISMYPKMWEATGLSYPRLIDTLIELALDRHHRRSAKRQLD
ncbi:MAG: D-alanine--D-alanine ligase [Acidimicrobiales bacterium]|nr:D-alanine--D-alanine ligase [Acidimicrobiales bacterium]